MFLGVNPSINVGVAMGVVPRRFSYGIASDNGYIHTNFQGLMFSNYVRTDNSKLFELLFMKLEGRKRNLI